MPTTWGGSRSSCGPTWSPRPRARGPPIPPLPIDGRGGSGNVTAAAATSMVEEKPTVPFHNQMRPPQNSSEVNPVEIKGTHRFSHAAMHARSGLRLWEPSPYRGRLPAVGDASRWFTVPFPIHKSLLELPKQTHYVFPHNTPFGSRILTNRSSHSQKNFSPHFHCRVAQYCILQSTGKHRFWIPPPL